MDLETQRCKTDCWVLYWCQSSLVVMVLIESFVSSFPLLLYHWVSSLHSQAKNWDGTLDTICVARLISIQIVLKPITELNEEFDCDWGEEWKRHEARRSASSFQAQRGGLHVLKIPMWRDFRCRKLQHAQRWTKILKNAYVCAGGHSVEVFFLNLYLFQQSVLSNCFSKISGNVEIQDNEN